MTGKKNTMEIKKIFKVTAILVMACALTSCATLPKMSFDELFSSERKDYEKDDIFEYKLGPDDVIQITVEQHSEWSGRFTIGPDGIIVIPILADGDFWTEGLTKDQLAEDIRLFLEQFINNPRVSVKIITYASQAIYVFGEVNRPGRIPTEGKFITLRDAILLAGLPTNFAATKRVYIISSSRKQQTRRVVNLHRILYRGELKRNIELIPGDVVYVPRTLLGILNHFLSALLSPLSTAVSSARRAIAP